MNTPDHNEYLENANFSLSRGVFHFEDIPNTDFISAICDLTKDAELYFPLDKSAGDLSGISTEHWSFSIRQIRLESDLLVEHYTDIVKFSGVRHLVLELSVGDGVPHFDDECISTWRQALINFDELLSFKIVFKTKRSFVKKSRGSTKVANLEESLDHLKSVLNPFSGDRKPETEIEKRGK